MPLPRVAIVGRPNVGKSSLLNMIAARKAAIVADTPGVTRDRVSAIVDLQPPQPGLPVKPAEFIDTGGFGVYSAPGHRFDEVGNDLAALTTHIERQIAAAVDSADLVLLCIDSHSGVTPQDEEIARMLRDGRLGRARLVRVVATKCDGPAWEAHVHDAASLGFGPPLACSAKSNYFRRDFLDALWSLLPHDPHPDRTDADLAIAIIGKRNAGKSTLINALAGQERVIVSEIPGTTRDAVDVRFELDGRSVLAIDTAGLRRKRSFQGPVEWYALDRAQRAVRRAHVVLMLLDATVPVSQVDQHLAQIIQAHHKPAILVVNKWDLAQGRPGPSGRPVTPDDYERYLRRELKGLAIAPLAFISARTGLNVPQTIDLAFDLQHQARQRVTTGRLNRIVRDILTHRGPSSGLGTFARVYYATQADVEPPTIVLVVNKPSLFTPNYRRYLLNRLRETLPFHEVPIRLVIRPRTPADPDTPPADAHDVDPHRADAHDIDALFDQP